MIELQQCYYEISQAALEKKKQLAALIDPENFSEDEAAVFLQKLPVETSFLLLGGSTVKEGRTCEVAKFLKNVSNLPIILFPGDQSQISPHADALLFLSLISGRNPEYLIEQQVRSVKKIRNTSLEIIPTGYILIDGGKECAVHRVSHTKALPQNDIENIVNTALAGQYSGKKLIYLEAGSGAEIPVSTEIISAVKKEIDIPLIVGGGIRSTQQLQKSYEAGADLVVIGTAFENGSFRN